MTKTYLSLKNVLNRPIARKGAWGYYSPKSALRRAEGNKTKIRKFLPCT